MEDRRGLQRQSGQAAIFALVFLGAMLLALNFIYKAGKLTSDKMEMQNAADAAAYSISLTEARDLNFAAYINRAMVANEVAIGQLMGLASWAFHWKSFADFLVFYDTVAIGPATLGISTPIIQAFTNAVFRIPGESVFIPFLSALANMGTSALHAINKFYSLAQYGYHTVTALFSVGILMPDGVVGQNAPPGTRISEFGIASLIAHFASFGSLPLNNVLPGGTFTEAYNPTDSVSKDDRDSGDDTIEGYERLAAIIRDSRDPFTMERGWEFSLFAPLKDVVPPPASVNEHNELGVDLTGGITIGVPPALSVGVDWHIYFFFGLHLKREGGSELRLVIPVAGSGMVSGEHFNWSSADTTNLVMTMRAGMDFWLEACGLGVCDTLGPIGASAALEDDGTFDLRANLPFGIGSFSIPGFPIHIVNAAPFGAGFAEAGRNTENNLNRVPHMWRDVLGGPVPLDAYGGAPARDLAWESTLPAPPGIAFLSDVPNDTRTRVNKSYRGLPRYVDTTGTDSTLLGFGAPFVLVSLVQDEDDYDKAASGPGVPGTGGRAPEMGGHDASRTIATGQLTDLRLTERFANKQLQVVARSEVYFSRPLDLNYFARVDGQVEHGSAFNPFWHARLTEARYVDKIIPLLVQQQQDFTGFSETIDLMTGFLEDLLP